MIVSRPQQKGVTVLKEGRYLAHGKEGVTAGSPTGIYSKKERRKGSPFRQKKGLPKRGRGKHK